MPVDSPSSRRDPVTPNPQSPTIAVREAASPSEVTPVAAEVVRKASLGRYQIEEEIARGGMGVVYRARDLDLGRTLALKVLAESRCGKPDAEGRFREEAQITAQLQHPCIPPVHEIGTLSDGRPFFAMKLIKGRTLEALLAERQAFTADLPQFLGIFELVCQAVAYAHSRGIIHRDLKPANIMVGAFGEVQVMDWGLAKLLGSAVPAPAENEALSTIATKRMDLVESYSREGDIIGTPGYMAPEQARGEIEHADKQSDVFGLGAILCKIVTGQPPFVGGTRGENQARSARGDLADAFSRLEASGADAELVELGRRCLAPERAGRPHDAGEVARAVAAYREGVQERLRQAELGRAGAEVRAQEERKRRRLVVGLAAVLFLLVLGAAGLAGFWQQQRARAQARQLQTDQETLAVLARARELLDEGLAEQDLVKLADAKARADRAVDIARTGSASSEIRNQADDFQAEADRRLDGARADAAERRRHAERNQTLLVNLLEVSAPHETGSYVGSNAGPATALPQPSLDEQYAAAFQEWGIDLDHTDEAEVVARLRSEPAPVVREVIAALDIWMLERWRRSRAEDGWRKLQRLADQLDGSARGRELRTLLVASLTPRPEGVAELWSAAPPWAGIWEITHGRYWRYFVELRRPTNPATEPVLTLVLLTQISVSFGDVVWAEQVLRQAAATRGDEVILLHALGRLLYQQKRLPEAIEFFRAARARDPRLGVALARTLPEVGRVSEAETILRDLARRQPDNPEMHYFLGWPLLLQRKLADAESAYREVIRLRPEFPEAHLLLAGVLDKEGKTDDAEAALARALELRPNYPEAYNNRGAMHFMQRKMELAETDFRTAIMLRPRYLYAHFNLGLTLIERQRLGEAQGEFQVCIEIQPDYAIAWRKLGRLLQDKDNAIALAALQRAARLEPDDALTHCDIGGLLIRLGRYAEAEAACRRAIDRDPNLAFAYNNLGTAMKEMSRFEEAEKAIRTAIALNPDYALAWANLGMVLVQRNRPLEAKAAFLKATEVQSDDAETICNLGIVLHHEGQFKEAEEQFRKSIALRPRNAMAHYNLGLTLAARQQPTDAVNAYQRSIELDADYAPAHLALGKSLLDLHVFPQAEQAFRRALQLKHDFVEAYFNLGVALADQNKLGDAVAAYQKAIDLKPDYGEAYTNKGTALHQLGKLDEAAAAYRKAAELMPNSAFPFNNLGVILMVQGRFDEALEPLQKALALRAPDSPQRVASQQLLEECRHWMALDGKLPGILDGTTKPAGGAEQLEYGRLCKLKKLFAAAARFHREAFAADPKLAEAPANRFVAACCAAKAGCGLGKDNDKLDDATRADWRKQALDWLQSDFSAWEKELTNNPKQNAAAVQQVTAFWRSSAEMGCVREPEALAKLPDAERKQWQELWTDIARLQKQAQAQR